MIDEFPALAIAAASGRKAPPIWPVWPNCGSRKATALAAMEAGLKANGVQLEAGDDWLRVTGGPIAGRCPRLKPITTIVLPWRFYVLVWLPSSR